MHNRAIYQQVAELHAAAIGQGFFSQLGPHFLTLLYEAIDQSPTSVLIVETREGRLCGFVSGGSGLGPIYRHLLSRFPDLIAALWPVIFSPRKLRQIAEVVLHMRKQPEANLPKAELYSIAVSPEFRGTGVAARLYRNLRSAFAERGITEFKIVVGDMLAPAQAFYRKMGAEPKVTLQVHDGVGSTVFLDRQA